MTPQEAVEKLDKLKGEPGKWGYDQEVLHKDADNILLEVVHPDVKAAYDKLAEDVGGFWYA